MEELKCNINDSEYVSGSFADRVHKIIYTQYLGDEVERNRNLSNAILNLVYDSDDKARQQKKIDLVLYQDGLIKEFELHFVDWLKDNDWSKRSVHFWIKKWNETAINIAQIGLADIAESMYKTLYRILREQEHSKGWIHKGTPLHQIGWSKLPTDEQKAKSYFLLALLEDIILNWQRGRKKVDFKSQPAYRVLKTTYSEPIQYLDNFEKVAKDYAKKNNLKKGDLVYPEEILISYVTNPKNRQRSSEFLDYDSVFAKYLYEKLKKVSTNLERGSCLEKLLAYIFLTQTNFEVLVNLRGIKDETDLRLRNFSSNDFFIEELGKYLLVEAKNTNNKIPVKEVNDLAQNIVQGGCNSGILVAMAGITGEKSNKDALYVTRLAYHKNNIIILTFRKQDLEEIVLKGVDIKDLLLEKYEKLRFDEYL